MSVGRIVLPRSFKRNRSFLTEEHPVGFKGTTRCTKSRIGNS